MINKLYGLLGLCARSGNIVSGMDATVEEIKKNKVRLLIVAEDASEKTISNIKFLAQKNNIPVIIIGIISENSKAIGKNNKAIIGVKDENIAEGIKKIFGGEFFG